MNDWLLIAVSVAFIAFTTYAIIQNLRLRAKLARLKYRNPTEVDLEWATIPQLITELRKRPVRFLVLFPHFEIDNIEESVHLSGVAIEVSGMPKEVALDVMQTAAVMLEGNEGQLEPPCGGPPCGGD